MISLAMALMLLMSILAVPAMADDYTVGTLSYLNMSEEDNTNGAAIRRPMMKFLFLDGVIKEETDGVLANNPVFVYYDSLNELLLALEAGKLNAIKVPYYTAKYLRATNDKLSMTVEYHPEKATGISELALSLISDGYSFLLKNDHTELRDEVDSQITAMKADGTLQKLIDEHIIQVAEGGEPVAVQFEQFEGEPIRIGVTGDLPPMDYVAADGSFAGFNTAVLAEIGRRLQKNIELVQVNSVARALALAEGKVDMVFWTRSTSEDLVEHRRNGDNMEDLFAKALESMTDEQKAILDADGLPEREDIKDIITRDRPADTIITQPYFTDFGARVVMK
jgi:ABC-type amino acid transport substrate-binding protein